MRLSTRTVRLQPDPTTVCTPTTACTWSAVAIVALSASVMYASSPKFFQASTQADFLKGEVENLSIDSHGRLVLGPATELIYESSAPFLWSIAAGSDGSLFVGSGNEGNVFRIDSQGKGSMFFHAAELEVHALAAARHPRQPGRQAVRGARFPVSGSPRAPLRRQGDAVRGRIERSRPERRASVDARRSLHADIDCRCILSGARAVSVGRDHLD